MHINNDLIKIPTINTSAQVNSSYIDTINVNNVIKHGKIVQFVFRGHVSQNIQSNTTIMTLPYPPLIGANNFFIQAIGSQYAATTAPMGLYNRWRRFKNKLYRIRKLDSHKYYIYNICLTSSTTR